MAFENLSEKLTNIFKKMRNETHLTEANMDEMLRQVRIALLEADVNFKVVKEFINNVKEKAVGQEVLKKLNPSQTVVKIVHEELTNLLGSDDCNLHLKNNAMSCIMLVGLQGSGKTTTAGKLAYLFKNKNHKKVMLVALDVYRPAAIEQLKQIGNKIDVEVFEMGTNNKPTYIIEQALIKARKELFDIVIIDTAGRLQIDSVLMQELNDVSAIAKPDETLLLVDAMAGQDAVNVANSFHQQVNLTGIIMSKLDGDARGGAALSIRHLTGLAIKFIGVGEKISDLELFHPDRMADRILGMGDVLTLVEKAKENLDEKEMKKSFNKMMDGDFDLNDMLKQLKQVNRLGSISSILKMIPGMPKISKEQQELAEKEMRNFEVILNSMTPYEKKHPEIIKNSQKLRISKGCGKPVSDINKVLKKFEQSKQMMKQMSQYKKSGRLPPGFNM